MNHKIYQWKDLDLHLLKLINDNNLIVDNDTNNENFSDVNIHNDVNNDINIIVKTGNNSDIKTTLIENKSNIEELILTTVEMNKYIMKLQDHARGVQDLLISIEIEQKTMKGNKINSDHHIAVVEAEKETLITVLAAARKDGNFLANNEENSSIISYKATEEDKIQAQMLVDIKEVKSNSHNQQDIEEKQETTPQTHEIDINRTENLDKIDNVPIMEEYIKQLEIKISFLEDSIITTDINHKAIVANELQFQMNLSTELTIMKKRVEILLLRNSSLESANELSTEKLILLRRKYKILLKNSITEGKVEKVEIP